MIGRNDEVYVLDALPFNTDYCSTILLLSLIFVKKSIILYGNLPIVRNC